MTVRAAFLRRLPGHGFAPPEAEVADLGPVPIPAGPPDARFDREVAVFARAFWDMPPPERRKRCDELFARAAGGGAAWLRELSNGLDVVPLGHTDPSPAELARLIREMFVLRPRERADRRLRWLTENGGRFPALARAARKLLRADMPLARLEPRVFDWLAAGVPPLGAVPPGARRHLLTLAGVNTAFWIGVTVLLLALPLALGSLGPTTPPIWQPNPVETAPPPQPPSAPRGFSVHEVEWMRAYEQQQPGVRGFDPQSGVKYPPRYAEWVAAGRPSGVSEP